MAAIDFQPLEQPKIDFQPTPTSGPLNEADQYADAAKGMMSAAGWANEKLDRYAGAPFRAASNELLVNQKARSLGDLAHADWGKVVGAARNQFGEDPEKAPKGIDIAFNSGIKDPYAGAAFGTALDLGGQVAPIEGVKALGLLKEIPAVAKAGEYLGNTVEGAGNAIKNFAEQRAFKALGPVKNLQDAAEAKGLVNSIGRTALDEGVVTPLASKKTMLDRADNLANEKEAELGGLLSKIKENQNLTPEQAQSIADTQFNPARAGEKLKSNLREEFSELPEATTKNRSAQIDEFLSEDAPKDIERAQKMKRQVSKLIRDRSYWQNNPTASQEGLMNIRRAIKEGIEANADAYASAAGEQGGQVKAINRQLGNAEEMQNILEDRISRNAANRDISPSDYGAGLAAYMKLGPKGLLAAPVNWFLRNRGNQILATGADSIASLLLKDPEVAEMAKLNPDAFKAAVTAIAAKSGAGHQLPAAADNSDNPKGLLSSR